MATLNVYMNSYLVGDFIRLNTGAHQFTYNCRWLETPSVGAASNTFS